MSVNWRMLTKELRAEFESQDAMMTPFLKSFVELEEAIDRSERNGVCSERVAKAARKKIISLRRKLDLLIVRKIALHRQFRVTEKAEEQRTGLLELEAEYLAEWGASTDQQ